MKRIKEEIHSYAATCYHRTGKGRSGSDIGSTTIKGIWYYGFKPGDGAMYGPAMYCTYLLKDQMNSSMISSYGNFIMKVKINLQNFIIFDKDEAAKVYGADKVNLRDQLTEIGFFKKFKAKNTVMIPIKLDRYTDTQTFDNDFFIKFSDTAYNPDTINNKLIKFKAKSTIKKHDDDSDILDILGPTGDILYKDIDVDNIDRIFFVAKKDSPDAAFTRGDDLHTYLKKVDELCEIHANNNYHISSDVAKPFWDAAANYNSKKFMEVVWGIVYSGRNDARCCISYHPRKNVVPMKAAKVPSASMALDSITWYKIPQAYLKRYFGVVQRKEPKSGYVVDPVADTDEFRNKLNISGDYLQQSFIMDRSDQLEEDTPLNEQAFRMDSLDSAQQQKLYDGFKSAYERATGHAWDQNKFMSKSRSWTFYGEVEGGIAVREQASGLIKLVASYGSPRGVINGFNELVSTNGDKPIWGAMDLKIAKHLESQGFSIPPGIVVKALAPMIAKTSGYPIGGVDIRTGALTMETEFGPVTKFYVANKPYYKWLVSNSLASLPGLVKKWIMLLIK